MKNICIIGTGYVGLTTGTCLADMGNHVVCIDVDARKIDRLKSGILPIHEPGLDEVVVRNMTAGRLSFTTSYAEGMRDADFVFIAVGTPDDGSGGADLSQVRTAAKTIAQHLDHSLIVVNKSTVPIGTGDLVTSIVDEFKSTDVPFAVVSNPEFLREGSALADCMHPDRIVLGASNREAAERVATLYLSLQCPIIITDLRTAEMIKYASNSFLATKISFINEVARICDAYGSDVCTVAEGMGLDPRIGPAFLKAGLGYGGSCFPKDVNALAHMADVAGLHPQLLRGVTEINHSQQVWVVDRIEQALGGLEGTAIGIWGLSFKPNTDDLREAPALNIATELAARGATVRGYDPVAGPAVSQSAVPITVFPSAREAALGVDALLVATEWDEFRAVDWYAIQGGMRGTLVFDGRNCLVPEDVEAADLRYLSIGRRPQAPEVDYLGTRLARAG